MSGWEAVIGLEIHVQLLTRTKLFCGDAVDFEAPSNTRVCPVCLGLPGSLPVLNRGAVELAVRAALGLGCTVRRESGFERKNYFYPDLPKGYQITQLERPLAVAGRTDWGEAPVRIRRVHLEEDAGRSHHDRFPHRTAIDLNRAGVALIEIVTEPDLREAAAARHFLTRLRRLLEYLEVSDCDLEKGHLRVDVNVSVRRAGDQSLGSKTEVKNLNSFAHVERALRYEIARQTRIREAGGTIASETLLWDAEAGTTRGLRSKEQLDEYRYFPEPDLPPLQVPPADVARIAAGLPELPDARERRLRERFGLSAYDAEVLVADRSVAEHFEAVAAAGGNPKLAANWVMTEVLAWRNERGQDCGFPMPPERLARLIALVESGRVSGRLARLVFAEAAATGCEPADIVEERGWTQIGDPRALGGWIEEALRTHGEQVRRYRAGEDRLFDFFVGRVMRLSGGRADPQRLTELLRIRLEE